MCCFLVAAFICMVAATSANAAKIYAEMQLFGDKISLQTGSETGNTKVKDENWHDVKVRSLSGALNYLSSHGGWKLEDIDYRRDMKITGEYYYYTVYILSREVTDEELHRMAEDCIKD